MSASEQRRVAKAFGIVLGTVRKHVGIWQEHLADACGHRLNVRKSPGAHPAATDNWQRHRDRLRTPTPAGKGGHPDSCTTPWVSTPPSTGSFIVSTRTGSYTLDTPVSNTRVGLRAIQKK